jgi:hypothetical protein
MEIELTEKETEYLLASVIEFYHRMVAAEKDGALITGLSERSKVARDLWRKVEKASGVIL